MCEQQYCHRRSSVYGHQLNGSFYKIKLFFVFQVDLWFMPYVNTNSIPRYIRTIPVQSYSPHWNVIINQKWTVDMHLFHPRFLSLCCWDCIFPSSFRCHPTGRHSKLKKTCCWRCVNDLSSCLSLTVVQHRVFIITSFAIITGTSGTYLHKIISVFISSDRKLIWVFFILFIFVWFNVAIYIEGVFSFYWVQFKELVCAKIQCVAC